MSKKRAYKRVPLPKEKEPEDLAERLWRRLDKFARENGLPPVERDMWWPFPQNQIRVVLPIVHLRRERTIGTEIPSQLTPQPEQGNEEKPSENMEEQQNHTPQGQSVEQKDAGDEPIDPLSLYITAREDERYGKYKEFELSQGRTPLSREQVIESPGRTLTPLVDITKIGIEPCEIGLSFQAKSPVPTMSLHLLSVGETVCSCRARQRMGMSERDYWVYERQQMDGFINRMKSETAPSKAKTKRRARRNN